MNKCGAGVSPPKLITCGRRLVQGTVGEAKGKRGWGTSSKSDTGTYSTPFQVGRLLSEGKDGFFSKPKAFETATSFQSGRELLQFWGFAR